MTGLHEELTGGSAPACRICSYLDTLTPAEAAEWRAELARPVTIVGNSAVVKALQRRNVPITETSVRRHRSRHAR